jgi:N-methylhydantoinase A
MLTIRAEHPPFAALRAAAERLRRQARGDLRLDRVALRNVRFETRLAARYAGQSHEIPVPLSADYEHSFHRAHERLYGYADRRRAVEVVDVCLRAVARRHVAYARVGQPAPGRASSHRLYWRGRWTTAVLLDRTALRHRARVRGPAVVTELSATTLIPPGWSARTDDHGHIRLRHAR